MELPKNADGWVPDPDEVNLVGTLYAHGRLGITRESYMTNVDPGLVLAPRSISELVGWTFPLTTAHQLVWNMGAIYKFYVVWHNPVSTSGLRVMNLDPEFIAVKTMIDKLLGLHEAWVNVENSTSREDLKAAIPRYAKIAVAHERRLGPLLKRHDEVVLELREMDHVTILAMREKHAKNPASYTLESRMEDAGPQKRGEPKPEPGEKRKRVTSVWCEELREAFAENLTKLDTKRKFWDLYSKGDKLGKLMRRAADFSVQVAANFSWREAATWETLQGKRSPEIKPERPIPATGLTRSKFVVDAYVAHNALHIELCEAEKGPRDRSLLAQVNATEKLMIKMRHLMEKGVSGDPCHDVEARLHRMRVCISEAVFRDVQDKTTHESLFDRLDILDAELKLAKVKFEPTRVGRLQTKELDEEVAAHKQHPGTMRAYMHVLLKFDGDMIVNVKRQVDEDEAEKHKAVRLAFGLDRKPKTGKKKKGGETVVQ